MNQFTPRKEENINSGSVEAPKSSDDEDTEDDYLDLYVNKKFIKSNYTCNCQYKLHLFLYPFLQWLSLMYNDRNDYINYQSCEYCGEPFHLYEKLIYPNNCKRNFDLSVYETHKNFKPRKSRSLLHSLNQED